MNDCCLRLLYDILDNMRLEWDYRDETFQRFQKERPWRFDKLVELDAELETIRCAIGELEHRIRYELHPDTDEDFASLKAKFKEMGKKDES